jgi:hypothetical protein
MKTAVSLQVEVRARHHWFVQGASVPGFGYHVTWQPSRRTYTCNCPSGTYRPHLACRHMQAVQRFRAKEREVAMGHR